MSLPSLTVWGQVMTLTTCSHPHNPGSTWALSRQLSLPAWPSNQEDVSDQCWGGEHLPCLGDSKHQEIYQEVSGGETGTPQYTEEETDRAGRERLSPALYKPSGSVLFLHLHQRSLQTSPRLGYQEGAGRQLEGGLHRGHQWLDLRYRGH